MIHNLTLLPIELQASIADLQQSGIPEAALVVMVERMLNALEAKTTKVQLDVWQIETNLGARIDKIGGKLEADLRTQHGATNGMLVDLRTLVQDQGAAVMALRAEFQSAGEVLSERIGGLEERMAASEADRKDIRAEGQRERSALQVQFNRLEASVNAALDRAMDPGRVAELVAMIERHEQLLSGKHEAGD